MRKVSIFIFLFFTFILRAQTPQVDSLYKALIMAKADSVKLRLRCKIGLVTPVVRIGYWDSIIKDAKKAGLRYYEALALRGMASVYDEQEEDATNTLNYFNKSLKIFEEIGDKKEVAATLHILGFVYHDRGDSEKGLEYFNKSLKLREEIDFKGGIGESLNNIGFIYQLRGDINRSLDYYLRAIKIFELINDKKNEAYLINNIAFLYQGQGDTTKALECYLKSLKLAQKINDKPGISGAYNNLAVIALNKGDAVKALDYSQKSLAIRRQTGDKKGVSASLNNIGSAYEKMDDINNGDYSRALKYYLEAFEIRKSIADKNAVARSYNSIGNIYFKQKNYPKSLEFGNEGYKLCKELGFPIQISASAKLLYKIYKQINKPANALEMHEVFIHMRDSINNEETRKSSTKKQFQYEYDKKVTADSVRTIEEKKTVAIQLKQEQTQRYALYGGLFLVLIFAGFMFNRFKVTQKQKLVIEQQKYIVEEKQKEIVDSITYAKRLQEAILPAEIHWSQNFKNGFVFYKPKDLVAGDFYWLEKVNDLVLFAVADCTGHGVPGALVSVVCSNALNRSVLEFGITNPGKILDKTRELVIATFEKSGEEVKDGMDISLCCLNTKTKELLWAGANNPLWYLSSPFEKGAEGDLMQEIKADKQPIGKYALQTPFTTHAVQLNTGDTLYLFTDGMADQFGGAQGKKFKYKRLKELLLNNKASTMDEQKAILESAFNAWKGELEQVDDVCVIGVRL
jgi:tetratricopeptide (TPR) repeat protein/serine phosphatase RsbU (regulator of sigma subunit)